VSSRRRAADPKVFIPLSLSPVHPTPSPTHLPPHYTFTMAERKVLSKYYPPDFDPNAITRKKPSGDRRAKPQPVRLMTPFSMKCAHCGEFIPKGRKFNASKEITDEHYMKVKILRFHIHCSRCRGEITFKTDPKSELPPTYLSLNEVKLTPNFINRQGLRV
jgi:hypothetical protein